MGRMLPETGVYCPLRTRVFPCTAYHEVACWLLTPFSACAAGMLQTSQQGMGQAASPSTGHALQMRTLSLSMTHQVCACAWACLEVCVKHMHDGCWVAYKRWLGSRCVGDMMQAWAWREAWACFALALADDDHQLTCTNTGMLSMANAGPNTNASQVFLTFQPAPWLDGKHGRWGCSSRGPHGGMHVTVGIMGEGMGMGLERSLLSATLLTSLPHT